MSEKSELECSMINIRGIGKGNDEIEIIAISQLELMISSYLNSSSRLNSKLINLTPAESLIAPQNLCWCSIRQNDNLMICLKTAMRKTEYQDYELIR